MILQGQQGMNRIVIIVAAVVVLLAASGFLIALANQNNSQTNGQSSSAPFAPRSNKEITDLGVELRVVDALQDLTFYKVQDVAGTVVGVSTESIAALAPDCAADKTAALGRLARLPGQYLGESPSHEGVGTLVKQFDDSYIHYSVPTITCTEDAAAKELIDRLVVPFKNALGSVRKVEAAEQ